METPPPPSQQQADEAQRARFAAEAAILSLFESVEDGGGGGENEPSILHTIKMAAILTALATAIILVSFRDPQDRSKSLLLIKPDSEQFSDAVLADAQREFYELLGSDLTDEQKAVLWATWAYSKTADEIATSIDRGDIPHEFADLGRKIQKVWISRSDAKVRPLHVELHGKTVAADDDFWRWPLTGQRLRYPGDREAPPEATIGCRCVSLLTWAKQGVVSDTIRRITESTRPVDNG